MQRHGPQASPSMARSEWVSMKEQLLQFFAIVAVAATVAFLGITLVEWQKRRSLPFCDTSYPYPGESCIPCPENGRCAGGDLECLPGFTRQGKSCLRDRETREAAKIIENYVVQQVCGHYSLPLCKWAGPDRLTIFDVTQLVETAKLEEKLGIDPVKVRRAKEQGISDAGKRLINKSNIESLQCPSDLLEYYKPYWCRVREWMLSNYSTFLVVFPIVLLVARILRRAYLKQKVSKRVEQLYLQVEQMVSKDSRIDQYPKLVKGESKVVWEWQVEGVLRSPVSKVI